MTPKAISDSVLPFLQYGSLGLLAIVLLGIGFGGYFLINGLLLELRTLSGILREAGQAAAAHFARSEQQISTLTERQETTQQAIERAERADTAGHQATQLLMIHQALRGGE